MKERPILMSAPMVRSLLNCTKSQTRRVVKRMPWYDAPSNRWIVRGVGQFNTERDAMDVLHLASPYGQPGDRLWVRENGWERTDRTPKMMREGADTWKPYYYDADGYSDTDAEQFKACGFKRRPSIHMPRWASRILLEIVSVRVERLQDISEVDALYEGAVRDDSAGPFGGYVSGYRALWESINGPGSWAANPWVWVVEFRQIEQ